MPVTKPPHGNQIKRPWNFLITKINRLQFLSLFDNVFNLSRSHLFVHSCVIISWDIHVTAKENKLKLPNCPSCLIQHLSLFSWCSETILPCQWLKQIKIYNCFQWILFFSLNCSQSLLKRTFEEALSVVLVVLRIFLSYYKKN